MTDPRTHPTLRRVILELHEEDVLSLPRLPRGEPRDGEHPDGEDRDRGLASLLRELFTRPGTPLESHTGAVLLDEDGRARALTAPFGREWPRADVHGLELLATAKMTGWPRLILFRSASNPRGLPDVALHFAQDMRALGLLFGLEVVDLLIVLPRRHWTLSKVPVLRECLSCEATLNRAFNHLIARGFERSLPPIEIPESTEDRVALPVERLIDGPFASHGLEGA